MFRQTAPAPCPIERGKLSRRGLGIGIGALVGAGVGAPLLALMALGRQVAGLPFAPFDLFSLVTRLLPGPAVTAGVEILVGALQTLRLGPTDALGKTIEAGLALALFLITLATLGAVRSAAPRLDRPPIASGALTGLGLWALLLPLGLWADWGPVGLGWVLVLSLGWGAGLGWTLDTYTALAEAPVDTARRSFLFRAGVGTVIVTAIGLGLSRLFQRPEPPLAALPGRPPVTPAPSTPSIPGGFVPVAGTRPELTPLEDFYRVDINLDAPVIAPDGVNAPDIAKASWSLKVSGLVERPLTLSYADLLAMPSEDFYATLECISNRVGGDLISTALFTGVPLHHVLNRAGLRPGVLDIKFVCAGGYTESLPLNSALDPGTRLCYGMEGSPLTAEHGFPVRLFTPDRFGMKNPKWIVELEAVSEDYLGYWEKRRWSDAAWVKTTSVIDTAEDAEPGALAVGGIAYAGARGIRKVEVRADDGEWVEAELKPPLSGLTWVLWRAHVTVTPGRRRLTVRATDGEGALQIERVAQPIPEGATGYHHLQVSAGEA